jgi:hypothetical protein
LSLATFWYKPSYWWVILTNPSFGGVPLLKLIANLFQGLLQFLPLVLAVLLVRWRRLRFTSFRIFALIFFVSFALLTAVRFLFDIDFIMDWTGFVPELQLAGVFLLAAFGGRVFQKRFFVPILIIISTCLFMSYNILFQLFYAPAATKQQNTDSLSRYQQIVSGMLMRYVPGDERVFLSGSSVFWINAQSGIQQIRGGNDMASIHQWWSHGAYQIREGEDAGLTYAWLKIFGASYILVHDHNSKDPFHDFKHISKFNSKNNTDFSLVKKQDGNYLYRVNGAHIARVASDKLLTVPSPDNGADSRVLLSYSGMLKRPAIFQYIKPDRLAIKVNTAYDEIISLAVSYDVRWKIIKGQGRIGKDAVGNMVIIPERQGVQELVLQYGEDLSDWLIPLLGAAVFSLMLVRFTLVYPYIQKVTSKLSLGLHSDEEEY